MIYDESGLLNYNSSKIEKMWNDCFPIIYNTTTSNIITITPSGNNNFYDLYKEKNKDFLDLDNIDINDLEFDIE